MSVMPADQIWRRAVQPVNLNDLSVTLLITPVASADGELVPDLRSHG